MQLLELADIVEAAQAQLRFHSVRPRRIHTHFHIISDQLSRCACTVARPYPSPYASASPRLS
eukprot:638646-Pleurochrysis_carterae.AAC.2